MAGAVFGEVGVSLFVAGAAFCEILGDSQSTNVVVLHAKCVCNATSKVSEAAGAR